MGVVGLQSRSYYKTDMSAVDIPASPHCSVSVWDTAQSFSSLSSLALVKEWLTLHHVTFTTRVWHLVLVQILASIP